MELHSGVSHGRRGDGSAYQRKRKVMKQIGSMRDQMATVAVWILRWRGTWRGAKL